MNELRLAGRLPLDAPPPFRVPLLLTARQAAALCGKSERTWRAWDSAGRVPRPVRIGRSTLWRFDELHAWVEAGCPRRSDWTWNVPDSTCNRA